MAPTVRTKIVLITVVIVLFAVGASTLSSGYFFSHEYSHALQMRASAVAQGLRLQLDQLLQLGIPMTDLMTQNNLTEESIIYEGQELLIVPANREIQETPEITGTPESDSEGTTATPAPTSTPTQHPPPTAQLPTPRPSVEPQANFMTNIFSGDTLWVGVGLVVVSIFGIALLLFTSARLR